MIVIVCGGRDFQDWEKAQDALNYWHARLNITTVVQGGQVSLDHSERHLPMEKRKRWGADFFGKRWAEIRGIHMIEERVTDADWKRLGKSAGPIRNTRMLRVHNPERVIAFPGGAGTEDMLRQARNAGVRCIEVA